MHFRRKAELALEILRARGAKLPFEDPTEDQLVDNAKAIISCASKLLCEEGAVIIDQLEQLGFNNQEIADRVHSDPSTLSRVHSKSPDLQISLQTLRGIVTCLKRTLPNAKLKRVNQTLTQSPMLAIDFCSNAGHAVKQADVDLVTDAVLKNVVSGLIGNFDHRIPLPSPFHGALARLGPLHFGISVYQSDGQDDRQRLAHEIHELEHIVNRMKDRLVQLGEKDPQATRPRGIRQSEF
jgi:hypothetical protein